MFCLRIDVIPGIFSSHWCTCTWINSIVWKSINFLNSRTCQYINNFANFLRIFVNTSNDNIERYINSIPNNYTSSIRIIIFRIDTKWRGRNIICTDSIHFKSFCNLNQYVVNFFYSCRRCSLNFSYIGI